MFIGRRIYFDKATGNVIQDTGEKSAPEDCIKATTIDEDFLSYTSLSIRNRDTVGVVELPYGAYTQDFMTCNGYKVDIATNKLVFSYPDPNNPTAPPITQPSYEDRLSAIEEAMLNLI